MRGEPDLHLVPAVRPGLAGRVIATVSRACGMASAVSSAVTAAANRSAACPRSSVSRAARSPARAASSASSAASADTRSSSPSSSASLPTACFDQPSTAARSPVAVAAAAERADQPGQVGAALLHQPPAGPGRPRPTRRRRPARWPRRRRRTPPRPGGRPARPGPRRGRDAVERLPGAGQQRRRVRAVVAAGRRVAGQRLVRGGRGRVQGVGVRQPLLLGQQVRVLALGRLAAVDLGQAGPQLRRPAAPARGRGSVSSVSLPRTSRCRWKARW